MGFNAFMFFKLKFADSNIFSRAPRSPNVREENISMHETSSCSEITQSLDDVSTESGSNAGGPLHAIEINSQETYEQSVQLVEDMFHQLISDEENSNLSTNIMDYQYVQLYTFNKPTRFRDLTIFRGVMRIGDFMKIGRITEDDRLDAFISISPGTVFRFYDDDKNDILINGFTTNDESTWDANHVVLGSVFKEHLKNNYALKTELPVIPNDLINEESLTTKLNDYILIEELAQTVALTFETNTKSVAINVETLNNKYVELSKYENEIKTKLGINDIIAYETDKVGYINVEESYVFYRCSVFYRVFMIKLSQLRKTLFRILIISKDLWSYLVTYRK